MSPRASGDPRRAGRRAEEFATLGGDFLSRCVVEIDYPGRRVHFLEMGAGNDSLIGAGLLKDFVVRLDHPRRRLWLGRPPGSGSGSAPAEATAPTSPAPPEAADPS